MIQKLLLLFVCLLLYYSFTYAQNRNNIWCFGDSAGIDFNNGAVPITSFMNGRGSCVSIADSNGQKLFYAATMYVNFNNAPFLARVFDMNDSVMANGDSIRGTGWYRELVIVPMPGDSMKYYLFSAGVVSGPGFSYSIIDMAENGGFGEVVQKNVLLQSFPCTDGINTVKHGNGRDWWIIFRRWDYVNDIYYKYLVTPTGISNVITQQIGSSTINGFTNMNFSPDGSKMAMINLAGLMEIYDFDRCTGVLSNPITIHPEPTTAPYGRFVGCEFSSNGRFLYISTNIDSANKLFQYDLQSPNPAGTRIVLDYVTNNFNNLIGWGFMKRGPDQRIYMSRAYQCQISPACYPYPDSVYNYVNMNLSVINYPDSLGFACGYAPYSFYLGGKRTYYGLPNNPDYDLGPLIGSPCDTLVGINEPVFSNSAEMFVYYTSSWQTAFINAQHVAGNRYSLEVFDMMGKSIFRESGKLNPPYFTKNLNCTSFATGIYTVVFQTEKERMIKRFIVE